jgi:hypothetical protein
MYLMNILCKIYAGFGRFIGALCRFCASFMRGLCRFMHVLCRFYVRFMQNLWDLKSHFRELKNVVKELNLKKPKQALGQSLQWPLTGPAAAEWQAPPIGSKDGAKKSHTQ